MCVVGNWKSRAEIAAILDDAELEYEVEASDPRMVEAFRVSACRVNPSLDEAEYRAIGKHTSVVYFLGPNFSHEDAPPVSHFMIRVGAALLASGGIAMKCESSGIAHSKERWLEMAVTLDAAFNEFDSSDEERRLVAVAQFWATLFDAFVRFPLADANEFYSCGMHLLGRPEMVVAKGDFPDMNELVGLFQTFGNYLISECDFDTVKTGHTFRADERGRRFRLHNTASNRYPEDDFFFNPYGEWRLTPIG